MVNVIDFPTIDNQIVWENAQVVEGTLTALNPAQPIVGYIDMLQPGVPHILSVSVKPTQLANPHAFMIVDRKPYQLSVGATTTHADTYTPDGTPARIQIINAAAADVAIYVDVLQEIPDYCEPWQTLALEVFAKLPSTAFTWDSSRWDTAVYDNPPPEPDTLFWDSGYWDIKSWWIERHSSAWQNILDPVTKLSISRSVNALGACYTAQTGTLTIEALDGLDPRPLGILTGAPVRLYDWVTRTPIFTGTLAEAKTSQLKRGGYVTTWQVVDKISYLAATQRYGAIPAGGQPEHFTQRIDRLMKTNYSGMYTPTRYTILGDSAALATLCGPTVMETSLASHIDAAVTTAGGYWIARRDGWLEISAAPPNLDHPVLTLSDDKQATPDAWLYTQARNEWNTTALITSIEVTNHCARLDDKNEWRADDKTVRVTSPTWSAAYGGASIRADMTAPDIETAKTTAEKLLRDINRTPSLTAAGLPLATRTQQLVAARLDPTNSVATISRGETSLATITAIKHEITPLTWQTNLTLQPAKQDQATQ